MSESKNYSYRLFMSFPGANTPICDTELEELAREQAFFEAVGVRLCIAAPEPSNIIEAWAASKGLYEIWAISNYVPSRQVRQTTLYRYNTGEVIYLSDVTNKIGRSIKEIVRIIEADLLDEPCPAEWTPGNKTLKDKF